MSDFFRSAFSYLSQAGVPGANTCAFGGKTDHHLVGSMVEMTGRKFKIRSLLAEGGYALVFAVQDQQGNWYAMKRQLAADRDGEMAIIREIRFMEELGDHPFIVKYLMASHLKAQSSSARAEFLMLMEMCSGGTLIDYFQKNVLTCEEICKIFFAVASAVQHMHDRSPPITHRDIKVENLLFDSNGLIKLCDFGSATTDIFRPNDDWNISKRTYLEEEMAKFTTPMYRAPEILDTYQNYPIGPAQDIWALGCILYYLCYRHHPFEDSAKLRIINAKYVLPDGESSYKIFHSLIRNTLQPNPYSRPAIGDVCEQISDIAELLRINLNEPVIEVASNVSSGTQSADAFASNAPSSSSVDQHCSSPTVGQTAQSASRVDATQASEVLNQLKEQGLSLFKNIKDKYASGVKEMGNISGIPVASQPPEAREPPRAPVRHNEEPQRRARPRDEFDPFAELLTSSARPQPPSEHSAQEAPKQKPPRPSPPTVQPDRLRYGEVGAGKPPSSGNSSSNHNHHHHHHHHHLQTSSQPSSNRCPSPSIVEICGQVDDIVSMSSRGLQSEPILQLLDDDENEGNRHTYDRISHSNISSNTHSPLTIIDDLIRTSDNDNMDIIGGNKNVIFSTELPFSQSNTELEQRKKVSANSDSFDFLHNEPTQKASTTNDTPIFDLFDDNKTTTTNNNSTTHNINNTNNNDGKQQSTTVISNTNSVSDFDDLSFFKDMSKPVSSTAAQTSSENLLLGGAFDAQYKGNKADVSDSKKTSSASNLPTGEFDPFATLLTSSFTSSTNASSLSSATNSNSARNSIFLEAKPSPAQPTPTISSAKPNYSRTLFDDFNSGGVNKPPPANAFDDILSSQGFSSSTKQANRTLADLKREEDSKVLDPITIKINDWTQGKERNIRALLGSLNDVLWEDIEVKWAQPSMAELLSYPQIKKSYRKACLVVHPDKQTGTPNELLAKAIFLELNDAWNAFEAKRVI